LRLGMLCQQEKGPRERARRRVAAGQNEVHHNISHKSSVLSGLPPLTCQPVPARARARAPDGEQPSPPSKPKPQAIRS
jgi:hypothetical protein